MGNAAFLLVAIGVSIVLSLLLWLRHHKPKTFMSSVEEFQAEMDALGRKHQRGARYRRRSSFRPRASTREETERR